MANPYFIGKLIRLVCMGVFLTFPASFATYSLCATSFAGNSFRPDWDQLKLTGSLQTDFLFPQRDAAIGADPTKEKILNNTYLDMALSVADRLTVGARLEYLDHPLPGFEKDFAGWGVPYFYAALRYRRLELTAGDFYEQFGNGLLLRLYEERSLGIDNALRGGRLLYRAADGFRLKALGGRQRRYWTHADSYVWGADAEWNIDRRWKALSDRNAYWLLGASYVGKHEKDEAIYLAPDQRLRLPLNIAAFDVRMQFQRGGYNLLADYAWKINDPSFDNRYSYAKGRVLFLSASYSHKGMSLLVQAKRSENMTYRSLRSQTGNSAFINHLPAFTQQHTYALAALYPYATHPLGEWAFQGSAGYRFRSHTPLGGKYGTSLKLQVSHIRALHSQPGADNLYYQDINLLFEKKIVRDFELHLLYMNQRYNQFVVEGHARRGHLVESHIYVADGNYRLSPKLSLRAELQYLHTRQAEGDWLYALLELAWLPSFIFSLSDMYNSGQTDLHYYSGAVTYTRRSHRLQLGYGRTRAGYNCAGGICRYVPASKGVQITYNFNF